MFTTSAAGIGFLGGFLTGLASSLHCIGLCGGIATSLALAGRSRGANGMTLPKLLTPHLGRVAAYVALGALSGSGGAGIATLLNLAGAHGLLRLLAAASLVAAGLSAAGIVTFPIPAPLAASSHILRPLAARARGRSAAPLALGLAWGLAPCAMVHGALLTAMLTGSALGGATFMAGFGMATILPIAIAASGAVSAMRCGQGAAGRFRLALGWATVALGLASLAEPARLLGQLCLG